MNRRAAGSIARAIGCAVLLHASAATAVTETVLHSFAGSDGRYPYGALLNVNGTLYGVTRGGGGGHCDNYGCGTVFSIDPITGTETVVHDFQSGGDGVLPNADLINVRGTLYGTTEAGGISVGIGRGDNPWSNACGIVFSLNPKTGAERMVHLFKGADGCHPFAGLINKKGTFYGTTYYGGTAAYGSYEGCGTVFSINPRTMVENVLHSFGDRSIDGCSPGTVPMNVNGTLYGTTYGGGACCGGSDGTVYSLDPETEAEVVLHNFDNNGVDGFNPGGPLIDVDGLLYGTTYWGGYGIGTIFTLDPATGIEAVIYSFDGQSYDYVPQGGLIKVGGKLYGTTSRTVYSFDVKTGSEVSLYTFCSQTNCADGNVPSGGLININGTLYGMTSYGGAYDSGTVFSIKP